MALKDNLKGAGDEIQRLNDLGTEFSAVYKDIGQALQGLARDSKDYGAGIRDAAKLSSDLAKSAQELSGFTKEDLKDRKKANDFAKKSEDLAKKRQKLESQIRVFRSQAINATKSEQAILSKVTENLSNSADYTKQIGEGFNEIASANEKLNSDTKFFDNLAELVQDVPVIGKVFKEFQSAADAARTASADGKNALLAGSKQLVGTLGKITTAFTAGAIRKGLLDFDERTTSVARNLNTSRQQAEQLVKSANQAARSIAGVTGKDITAAQEAFANTLGTTAALTEKTAANFATIQNKLGLSVDEASELTKFSIASGEAAEDLTTNIIGEVQASNALNKSSIRYQDVLKDISKASKAVLVTLKAQGKSLADAATNARKFGLDLNKVDAIAGNLLNFEESISAELEAELLTGRQLNLERARLAALNGDIATLTQEIATNVGSAAEFGNMNRIQQEAIAKAVGMTREELAASLVEQQALTALGARDKNDLREKVRLELERVNSIADATQREKARQELIGKLGDEELVRQQENRNLTELQAEASQKIIEAFDKLSPLINAVSALFAKIADNAGIIATVLAGISVVTLVSRFRSLLNIFSKIAGLSKTIGGNMSGLGGTATKALSEKQIAAGFGGKAAKEALKTGGMGAAQAAMKGGGKGLAKTGGKFLGKSLLKKIPIVGALAGIGFGLSRLAEGDVLGAAGEVASGLAGTIPGVGTAASIGIDTALAARDMNMSAPSEIEAEDFTIKTHPKDEIVVAGGTNLSGGSNQEMVSLLKELVAAAKQGQNVTVAVDGTNVFKAMNTSRYMS
jgi:hypothetical protein